MNNPQQTQNPDALIFLVPAEKKLRLTSKKHAFDIMRYFFSQTDAHPVTPDTPKNYFARQANPTAQIKARKGTVWDAKRQLSENLAILTPILEKYEPLSIDILYVMFFVKDGDTLLTNAFFRKNNPIYPLEADGFVLDPETSDQISKDYFGGNDARMDEVIGEFINQFEPEAIRPLEECDTDKALIINQHVFAEVARLSQQQSLLPPFEKPVFFVSHLDQPGSPYHVHRMMLR